LEKRLEIAHDLVISAEAGIQAFFQLIDFMAINMAPGFRGCVAINGWFDNSHLQDNNTQLQTVVAPAKEPVSQRPMFPIAPVCTERFGFLPREGLYIIAHGKRSATLGLCRQRRTMSAL
jgi:hypothetical protein